MTLNNLYKHLLYIRLNYQFLNDELFLYNDMIDCLKPHVKLVRGRIDVNIKNMYEKILKIIDNKRYYLKKYNLYFIIDNKDDIIALIKSFEYRLPLVYTVNNENDIIEIKKRLNISYEMKK